MSTSIYPRVIHLLTSVTIPADNVGALRSASATVVNRGQTVTISPEQYEATKDRLGNSWLDLDEEAQEVRFGEVRFRDGVAPDGVHPWDHDEGLKNLLRETELAEARKLENTAERADAVAAIFKKYGRGQTSQTIAYIG